MQVIETDYLIIGSGVAGLSAALWSAPYGNVIVISKDRPENCNSTLAQGGIAAAVSSEDSPVLHCQDTLKAGAGICRQDRVELLTAEAPRIIQTLLDLGARFDRSENGELALGREGAHSLARVLHHGDDTGAEIWQTLYAKVRQTSGITLVPGTLAVELTICQGRCTGAIAYDGEELVYYAARGVVLATGGCGQIFGRTTNSLLSTGDGLALAWRAGASLTDLEFVQFHPTALNLAESPYFLISEAVRGEGAFLITDQGKRFMPTYHPMADLAPRDVVSRAITLEQLKGRSVYLDATSIGPKFAQRFPNICAKLKYEGIDPVRDPIPVTPAAHFTIGGVQTDSFGRTDLPGLFACGEVASTGVHGANRLASNSLLEGLVFGQRVAMALGQLPNHQAKFLPDTAIPFPIKPLERGDKRLGRLQEIMWTNVGIIRDEQGMSQACRLLKELARQIGPDELELQNMVLVAELIASSALERLESRGSHFRLDYPEPSSSWQHQHLSFGRHSA